MKYAHPGESVTIKADVPHKFWNPGKEVLKCKSYLTPADNFMYFITELYRSINANNGRPAMFDAAFLLTHFKSEFAMLEIPAFVQKFIFPIVLFCGNAMGKARKFGNAPVPISL